MAVLARCPSGRVGSTSSRGDPSQNNKQHTVQLWRVEHKLYQVMLIFRNTDVQHDARQHTRWKRRSFSRTEGYHNDHSIDSGVGFLCAHSHKSSPASALVAISTPSEVRVNLGSLVIVQWRTSRGLLSIDCHLMVNCRRYRSTSHAHRNHGCPPQQERKHNTQCLVQFPGRESRRGHVA